MGGVQSVSMKGKGPRWEMIDGSETPLFPKSVAQGCQGQCEVKLGVEAETLIFKKTDGNPSHMVDSSPSSGLSVDPSSIALLIFWGTDVQFKF